MANFDYKKFDSDAFSSFIARIPSIKIDELKARRAFVGNSEIRSIFRGAANAAYAKIPLYGAITGAVQNYDGITDIIPVNTPSYEFGTNVIGRAKAWTERDFTSDLTGDDFMDNVARQIAEYWETVDEATLIAILSGIFSLRELEYSEDEGDDYKRVAKSKFIDTHTLDISEKTGDDAYVGATTLNTAIQKACGANKGKFTVALLHSVVATNLENLQLLNYMTYTDSKGITRDLSIGSWNGRSIIVSDALPTKTVLGKGTIYTSYILGEGAFFYENIGAKVPYEMYRDPSTNGGSDILYSRQRKVIHPFGFDYVKKEQASLSPEDTDLENPANWELVFDSEDNPIDVSLIPIARIISLG